MFKQLILGSVLVLTVGTGISQAQPWYQPSGQSYHRIAREWVKLYLRRDATDREVLMLVNQLRGGSSPNEVQATILGSSEYYRKSGANVNTWATWVIRDVLNRQPQTGEQAVLVRTAAIHGRQNAALVVLDSRFTRPVPPPWWWGW